MDLNLIANQLLMLDHTVLNVKIFVNKEPIQIVDLGMGGQGKNYHEEEHVHDHEGITEGPVGSAPPPEFEHHEYDGSIDE